jgi:hypothetical protein
MLKLFANIGYFFLVINLLLFLKEYKSKDKSYKIFTFYIGAIVLVQIVSVIYSSQNINNLFLSHFYFIGQFVLLSLFFETLLKEKYQKKVVKAGLILGLLVLGIQYGLDPSLFLKFNLFEIFITSFLLIIYATFHFYNMLNEKKEFYYINMGILLYLFGSTILFLAGNISIKLGPKFTKIPWILNSFLYIIYQVFILVEWKKSFSKKNIQ